MKSVRIVLLLSMLAVATGASAQFTISETPETKLLPPVPQLDRKKVNTDLHVEARSEVAEKYARQERRKERNTVTIQAELSLWQVNYDNWASGGNKNLSVLTGFSFTHIYKNNKFSNTTRLNANYGLNYEEKKKFKNKDNFLFQVTPSWQIHKNWSYSGDARLQSQFDKGFKNRADTIKRSNFMAPGTMNITGGIKFKKNAWEILAAPVGGKATFMLDKELSDKGTGGVEKGKRVKWEAGPSLKIIYEKNFGDKVFGHEFKPSLFYLKSDMYFFSNLKFKQDPTANWLGKFMIRPMGWLAFAIDAQGIFDKSVETEKSRTLQLQYTYTVALTYTFKNK